MLVITVRCSRPTCFGTVRTSFEPVGEPRRLLASCDECGAAHSVIGGQFRLERPATRTVEPDRPNRTVSAHATS